MNITKLFKEFFESEKAGGFILIACALIAIVLSNLPWGVAIQDFLHSHFDLSFAGLELDHSVEAWVNDGLMTIFFLLIGLEIERELYVGELSNFRNAILPLLAAIGGMVFPALIHYSLNADTSTASGFGIPMATDIAFALGILSLAGKNIPVALKIFLTAFAIIDDLGAIVIIAIFYNNHFALYWFLASIGIFCLLYIMGRFRMHALWVYLAGGLIMWYCMMQSGVHATIAGVLLAFAIPFPRTDSVHNPSYRLQHLLHRPVAFIILPVFALVNTAIILPADILSGLGSRNSLGIIVGLIAGKVSGILIACFIAVKTGWALLPKDVTWGLLLGVSILGGIGFTMSIFITNLAFNDPFLITSSKISILVASCCAGIGGLLILRNAQNKTIT